MPAVIQTQKGVEKHIDGHTSADNTELGDGTPWVFSPDRKLSLVPDTFLLHSRAPNLQWTSCARHLSASQQGPGFILDFSRPAWAPVLLPVLFPFVPKSVLPWSRDPRWAPKCSACSPSPQSGKKTPWNNAIWNRGIYYWLQPGPPALTKGVRTKGPDPQFSRVFIGYNY